MTEHIIEISPLLSPKIFKKKPRTLESFKHTSKEKKNSTGQINT